MGALNWIRKAVRSTGFDVITYRPARSKDYALQKFLHGYRINLLLDVGANEGQFAQATFAAGYNGRILSFEPISTIHQKLSANAATNPRWQVHAPVALGAEPGELEINVSGFSPSSSLLPMTETHLNADPSTAYVRKEKVAIRRLDDCIETELDTPEQRIFLKLDVQGFEAQALQGAPRTLAQALGVLMEVSFAELYQGQELFLEACQRMQNAGFSVFGLYPEFSNPQTGQLLTADALFYRPGNPYR